MCNDLRVEVARGYGVKGWISLAKFERWWNFISRALDVSKRWMLTLDVTPVHW
jgi:hypothetical protein